MFHFPYVHLIVLKTLFSLSKNKKITKSVDVKMFMNKYIVGCIGSMLKRPSVQLLDECRCPG